jgi:hypothetical protein
MGTSEQIDKIIEGFPTARAAIRWTALVAAVSAVLGFGASYFYFSGKIAALEERLKLAQESKGASQIRISEVTIENPYRVQPTDDFVQVALKADVSPVILLPSGFVKGKTVSIKDKNGSAPQHQIIVRAEGGTIDGLPEWRIASAFGSIGFVWDGQNWSAY